MAGPSICASAEDVRSHISSAAGHESFERALQGVEREDGQIAVLSRYGSKVEEIDGRKLLVAGTQEDAAKVVPEARGIGKQRRC